MAEDASPPSTAPSLVDSLFQRPLYNLIKSLRSEPGLLSRVLAEIRREIRSPDPDTKAVALQKLTYLSSLHGLDASRAAFHALELLPSPSPPPPFSTSASPISPPPSPSTPPPPTSSPCAPTSSARTSPLPPLPPSPPSPSSSSPSQPPPILPATSPPTSFPSPLLAVPPPLLSAPRPPPPLSAPSPSPPTPSPSSSSPSSTASPPPTPASSPPPSRLRRTRLIQRPLPIPTTRPRLLPRPLRLPQQLDPHQAPQDLRPPRPTRASPRLAACLVDPLCDLLLCSSAQSLVFECVRTVFSGLPDHDRAVRLAVDKVREFLASADDPNLRYLGLRALSLLGPRHSWAVEESREAIIRSFADTDPNIRRESLRLIMGMVFESNVVEISALLINYAMKSDPVFANEIFDAMLTSCGRNAYELIVDFDWYVSLLGEMARNPHCTRGEDIERQLVDIGLRVRDARPDLVRVARDLSIDPALLGNPFLYRMLSAAAWASGEYVEFSRNPLELVEALL